jgi:hypothetical protein
VGKQLVPLTMIAAMLGFATAALTIGFVPDHPTWWRAAVSLAVLGGVTIPRLAGHPLRWPRLVNIQLALLGGGVLIGAIALVYRGYGHLNTTVILGAQLMVSAGFILFALIIGGTFFARKSPATVSTIQIGKRPQTAGR